MNGRFKCVSVALTLLLVCASGSTAFDGSRTGSCFGGGVGVGVDRSFALSSIGLQTDLRFGQGISEHVQIWGMMRTTWFREEVTVATPYNKRWDWYFGWVYDYSYSTKKVTASYNFFGVGMSYFIQPQAPSLYLFGGIGRSIRSNSFNSGSGTMKGKAITGGVGYEFARHWMVEGSTLVSWSSDHSYEGSMTNYKLMLICLLY